MARTPLTTLALLALAALAGRAVGHVRYVSEDGAAGGPLDLFTAVLEDPLALALFTIGGLLAVGGVLAYLWLRPLAYDVAAFRETMLSYTDLLPWTLRLSLGLPLVGAGFAGYFISPAVPPFIPVFLAPSRLFQLAIGMALLFGFASRFAAVLGLAVYLFSLPFFPELLLASEYAVGFLAIVLVGSGRPSADHVLQQVSEVDATVYGRLPPIHRLGGRLERRVAPYADYAATVIRIGLGATFVYLGAVEKLLQPGQGLAVVEKYALTAVVPVSPEAWVLGAGLVEIALGLALIAGVLTRGMATVALGTFTLTLFALPDDPVLAHISLFGLSSALMITGSGPLAIDEWLRERRGVDGSGSQRAGESTTRP